MGWAGSLADRTKKRKADKRAIVKVSFIIPAHNAELTISNAIYSVVDLFKSRLEYEILVIENGSSDKTTEIVTSLAGKFEGIRLFHSAQGVSNARNFGIRKASGDWVFFLDADDSCEIGLKEVLALPIRSETDIVLAGYQKGIQAIVPTFPQRNKVLQGELVEDVFAWMLSRPTERMTVWAKLFRREFLILNNLYFDSNLTRSEDSEFLIRAMKTCRSVVVLEKLIYRYRMTAASTMRSATSGVAPAYIAALKKAIEDTNSCSLRISSTFQRYVCAQIIIIAVHDFFNCEIDYSWLQRCQKMREFRNMPIIKQAMGKISMKQFFSVYALPVFLFKYHLIFCGGMICYVRSLANHLRKKE